jgi:hypothetical protein
MKPWLSNCVDVKLRIGHATHNTNNRLYILIILNAFM